MKNWISLQEYETIELNELSEQFTKTIKETTEEVMKMLPKKQLNLRYTSRQK